MHENELKALWQKTFGDEEEYINRFFEKVYKSENVLIHQIEGYVAAMLYMIPYDIEIGSNAYKAVYLYALATEEIYRGRKLMSGLIKRAHDIAEERGYIGSFLIPADEPLFDFYKKFGYDIPFYEDRIIIDTKRLGKAIRLIPADIGREDIWKMQNNFYRSTDKKVVLSKEQFLFYLEDFYNEGGKVYCVMENNRKIGYVCGFEHNENIEVCNTDIDSEVLKGEKINAYVRHIKKGLVRPSHLCEDSELDLNGLCVDKVLC